MLRYLEKYFVYFYILSFFILVAMMVIYKKERHIKKTIIIIASIILIFQFFVLYNTYSYMEPACNIADTVCKACEQTDKICQDMASYVYSVNNNKYLLQYKFDKEDPEGIYVKTNAINDAHKKDAYAYKGETEILNIINAKDSIGGTGASIGTTASIGSLSNLLTDYSSTKIGNLMAGISTKFKNTLQNIAELTTPVPQPTIAGYYSNRV